MKHVLSLLAFLLALPLAAQEGNNTPPPSGETPPLSAEPALQVHGSLRTDALVPQYDERIGTDRVDNRVLSNSYLDLRLAFRRRYEAGLRAEYMKQPLPGFDPAFRGAGVPYFYATARFDRAEITLGSYYEQFGSGLVLRTYEEPSLGIDNHLRGLRLTARPFEGVRLKALAGRQRNYWETDASYIYGADGEWDLPTHHGRLTLGASWVMRREQPDALSRIDTAGFSQTFTLRRFHLVQPTNVSAFDLRAAWHTRRWQWLAEYAWKGQDPSFDNGYTYRHGSALLRFAPKPRGLCRVTPRGAVATAPLCGCAPPTFATSPSPTGRKAPKPWVPTAAVHATSGRWAAHATANGRWMPSAG